MVAEQFVERSPELDDYVVRLFDHASDRSARPNRSPRAWPPGHSVPPKPCARKRAPPGAVAIWVVDTERTPGEVPPVAGHDVRLCRAAYGRIVQERTRRLWEKQDRHHGDRHRLFLAVAEAIDVERALYPGSYVDLAPSFVWPSVTYVDIDRRAGQFFGDGVGVQELLVEHGVTPNSHSVRFIAADYTDPLGLDEGEFDLLISLYAGFVSAACTRHLRVGGTLLVNSSHGDVAMASIDPRYRLSAVMTSRSAVTSWILGASTPTSCRSVTSR